MVPEVDNFHMQSVAERRYQYWEAFTTQSIEGPHICAQQQSNQNQPILQSTPLFVRTESLSWNEVNTMELDAPCRILTACKLVSLWEKKTAASEVAELFRRESLAGKLHDIAQCLEEDGYIEMTVKRSAKCWDHSQSSVLSDLSAKCRDHSQPQRPRDLPAKCRDLPTTSHHFEHSSRHIRFASNHQVEYLRDRN